MSAIEQERHRPGVLARIASCCHQLRSDAMKSAWLFGGVVLFALLVAAVATSQHPHEQTVFLERIADKIEHVKIVPPETERAIRAAVQSIRRNESQLDKPLQSRQQQAVARIEAVLTSTTAAIQPKHSDRPRVDARTRRVSNSPPNE